MKTWTDAEIQAQKTIANEIVARGSATTESRFAHIGFLRATPRGRPSKLGIRFFPTGDLLGQRCDHGALWESVAVVDLLPTAASLRERMTELFQAVCVNLGLSPLPKTLQISVRSMVSFATAAEAETLANALREAGEGNIDVYHWDPAKDSDFDRDQWQVSWGTL